MAIARLIGQAYSASAVPSSLRWFYASVVLRRAADALLLVIAPVFFYQLGPRLAPFSALFPTPFEAGIAAILTILLLGRVAHLILAQPLAHLLQRQGLRQSIILGQLARFLMLVLYSFSTQWPELVWPATLLWALVLGWYFPAYHLYLAEKLEVGKIGRELSTLEILIKLALVTIPLLGVFLYAVFGAQNSFLLASALMLLSTLFLVYLPDVKFRTQWHWTDLWESWNIPARRRQLLGLAGKTWEEHGLATFFPLFLFLTYQDIVQPGYILTSASLFSLIVVYLAGWSFDRSKSIKPVLLSGTGSSLFWIARFFLVPFPVLFVVGEALERLSSNFFSLSFFAHLIQRIRQGNPVLYVHNREVVLDMSLVIGSLALFLLLLLGWNWLLVFLSFAGAGLLSLTFVKRSKKR